MNRAADATGGYYFRLKTKLVGEEIFHIEFVVWISLDTRNNNISPASLFVLKIRMNCSEKYIPYGAVSLIMLLLLELDLFSVLLVSPIVEDDRFLLNRTDLTASEKRNFV